MKTKAKSLILAASFLLVTMAAGAWAFQNEPDGFRGVKWTTAFKEFKGMILNEDGDYKFYSKKGDKLSIGEATLKSLTYGFYKNQFCAVSMEFIGYDNYSKIKQTLEQQYGTGYQDNPYIEQYQWISDSIIVTFKYSDITKQGSVLYMYRPIINQQMEDAKNKAKDGASDL